MKEEKPYDLIIGVLLVVVTAWGAYKLLKPEKKSLSGRKRQAAAGDNFDKGLRERIRECERQDEDFERSRQRPEWSDTGRNSKGQFSKRK